MSSLSELANEAAMPWSDDEDEPVLALPAAPTAPPAPPAAQRVSKRVKAKPAKYALYEETEYNRRKKAKTEKKDWRLPEEPEEPEQKERKYYEFVGAAEKLSRTGEWLSTVRFRRCDAAKVSEAAAAQLFEPLEKDSELDGDACDVTEDEAAEVVEDSGSDFAPSEDDPESEDIAPSNMRQDAYWSRREREELTAAQRAAADDWRDFRAEETRNYQRLLDLLDHSSDSE